MTVNVIPELKCDSQLIFFFWKASPVKTVKVSGLRYVHSIHLILYQERILT